MPKVNFQNNFHQQLNKDLKKVFIKNEASKYPIFDLFIIGHGTIDQSICGMNKKDFIDVLYFFSKSLATKSILPNSLFKALYAFLSLSICKSASSAYFFHF